MRSVVVIVVSLVPGQWVRALGEDLGVAYEAVGAEGGLFEAGVPSREGAELALLALQEAAQGCVEPLSRCGVRR